MYVFDCECCGRPSTKTKDGMPDLCSPECMEALLSRDPEARTRRLRQIEEEAAYSANLRADIERQAVELQRLIAIEASKQ